VSGFLRTFLMGLGFLALLMFSAGVTALVMLKQSGQLPNAMRSVALTDKERAVLEELENRSYEPPPLRVNQDQALDETLRRIAEMSNESTVRQLVEKLSSREEALSERATLMGEREAELRLAETDLVRLRRELDARRDEVQGMLRELEARSASWADAKLREAEHLQTFSAVERARLEEAALRYQSSRNPWEILRTLEDPREIARLLLFMEPKKAAKVLDTAVKDPAYRDMPRHLHHAMLTIDRDGLSGDQVVRLAGLYSLMRPEQVLPYLGTSNDDEVVALLRAITDPKRSMALVEALIADDPVRGQNVQRQLDLGEGGAR
jgi:arsenate reductase-like glutaredoxin family protein